MVHEIPQTVNALPEKADTNVISNTNCFDECSFSESKSLAYLSMDFSQDMVSLHAICQLHVSYHSSIFELDEDELNEISLVSDSSASVSKT